MSALRYFPVDALLLVAFTGVLAAGAISAPALLRGDTRRARLIAARVLLLGAVLTVAVLTLGGGTSAGVNLIPGDGIRDQLNNVNEDLGRFNVLGNILILILTPIGFLLPLAARISTMGAILACALFCAAIEMLQLMLSRSFDVDDILLNTLGGTIGAILAIPLLRYMPRT